MVNGTCTVFHRLDTTHAQLRINMEYILAYRSLKIGLKKLPVLTVDMPGYRGEIAGGYTVVKLKLVNYSFL